jgi:mono/diheme cytochrome c family protein
MSIAMASIKSASLIPVLALLAACQPAAPSPTATPAPATDLRARGEYLIKTTGCNDCHTAGYAEQQGKVDKTQWLTGSPMGYHGPWGTTYAANLRLLLQDMDEAQWLERSATLRTRPIMPDFSLRAMSEVDRRAIFHFVRSLGPAGQPAPAYLPPGQVPPAPYFSLVLPPAPPAPARPGARASTAAPASSVTPAAPGRD